MANSSNNGSSNPQSTVSQNQSAVPHGREQELKTSTSVTGAGETSVPHSTADDSGDDSDESARRQSDSGSIERSEDGEKNYSQGV